MSTGTRDEIERYRLQGLMIFYGQSKPPSKTSASEYTVLNKQSNNDPNVLKIRNEKHVP